MPHASFKILPGVDQNKTPALNEAAISQSQLIRFIPDRNLGGLVQKLGGWSLYYSASIGSIARALLAWEDTNSNARLAVGSEGSAPIQITNIVGNGSSVVASFAAGQSIPPNSSYVLISGANPSIYDGYWQISSQTSTSITFSSTITSAYISGGTIQTGTIASLQTISNGQSRNITPQYQIFSYPFSSVQFTTSTSTNTVSVSISGVNIGANDSVFFKTPVSINGLIISGQYATFNGLANSFSISVIDAAGNPVFPNSSSTSAGTVSLFTASASSSLIKVTLANHGLIAGSTFAVLTPVTIGGTSSGAITLYGNYVVAQNSLLDANNFYINAANTAGASLSSYTSYQNNNSVYLVIYRGLSAPASGTGYGIGGYGSGAYGGTASVSNSTSSGTQISAPDWTIDNWGEVLVSCPLNGPIYAWSPTQNLPVSTIIPTAPPVNQGVFVAMPQRQVIAWGTTSNGIQDPLLIRWSDVGNYNTWIASLVNQAGSYRIPKGSRIVQCIQGPQQALVWTDLGLWAMQYVGQPYIYQFNEIGNGCGLIGRKAATSLNGNVYWMGQSQFFQLTSGGVQPIACPVWDVIFQDLDTNNLDKIRVAPNSRFGEVSWYYPTTGNGGEINAYVKYNIVLNQWDFGALDRTAWINESVLGPPIGAAFLGTASNSFIVQHETSPDAVTTSGSPAPMISSFQTGYFALTDANIKIFIDEIWPDMKWGYYNGYTNGAPTYQTPTASVQLTFYVADYPGQAITAENTFGPFTMTQASTFITPRLRGRLVSILIQSSDLGSFWRMGNMRYRYQPDGRY